MVNAKTGVLAGLLLCFCFFSAVAGDTAINERIAAYVQRTMREGNIPGLSLVYINNGRLFVTCYGYADRTTGERVNETTLFQLASCSKAFTALAVELLESRGRIGLDDPVTTYLPWFRLNYKGRPVAITIRQLLHHTSGIPWSSMKNIPEGNDGGALERTVRTLPGTELSRLPGKRYEYATINYDVLALIIQKVSGQPFEDFVRQNILTVLGLKDTRVGEPAEPERMAQGYKIGFFSARRYDAPVYRGNDAGGYVISDARDMARWLQFQLGLLPSGLYAAAERTHLRDETVYPHDMSCYAAGWEVSLRGDGEIAHSGLNPNFTAFVGFRPETKMGVVVLANSNSGYTQVIGRNVLRLLSGEGIYREFMASDGNDRSYSILSFLLGAYVLAVIAFLGMIANGILKKQRTFERPDKNKMIPLLISLAITLPFFYGLYLLPEVIAGFSWKPALVWSPVSFLVFMVTLVAAVGLSYLAWLICLVYPDRNKFKRQAPQILLMSMLSGVSNMLLILLVTSAIDTEIRLRYIVFYFLITITIYLVTRRYVQVTLINFTNDLIYELRVKVLDKIFDTSYQKFEQLDSGRVYTALNDDVETLGGSANMFVTLVISLFTVVGAFIYLSSIAFWASLTTAVLIILLSTLYFFVSRSTNRFFEEARNTREKFIRLINGMVEGFKEISLHRVKRTGYKADTAASALEYKTKITTASIRFVNASIFGELILITMLGIVGFGIRRVFPEIRSDTVMSFLIVLLYLIGPINTILGAVPSGLRIRIAWQRIQRFLKDIPANMDLREPGPVTLGKKVGSIKAAGVSFRYKKEGEDNLFSVGPIDLEVKQGEIVFIIGGNGSGKTTLSKLLTGLYEPDQGKIMIDGQEEDPSLLGENFSTVFSPFYLFEKMYRLNGQDRSVEIAHYLKLLELDKKVEIKGNSYNTLRLSGGQRKRLALLQCYLEDSPIFLFDEWAADQDPAYRNFFYRTLLPDMKGKGKIIIAITHDDHYFDVADRVLKMENGKLYANWRG